MKKLLEFKEKEIVNLRFVIGGTIDPDDDHDKKKDASVQVPTQGGSSSSI